MANRRLLSNHPLEIKRQKLENFCRENKIELSMLTGSKLVVKDTETNVEAVYKDDEGNYVQEFPYDFDGTRLVIEE